MKTIQCLHNESGKGMRFVSLGVLMCSAGLALISGCSEPVPVTEVSGAVTVFFDGADASNGDTDFAFQGATFSGGTVRTLGNPALYGSGLFAYEVEAGSTVTVIFDAPVDFLELVFIRSGGSGTLTAFDAEDNEVGSVSAGDERVAQMVELTANAVRVEVVHSGGSGWIDNFTFRTAP